jgi:hypothetical protein
VIRLEHTFEFALDEVVAITVAGKTLTAVVDSCSISRHMATSRYYCEWIDAKETVNGRWFDEAELVHEANK